MQISNQDNIEFLKAMKSNSIDAVVTDPPYGLSFMNKHWDHDVPSVELWREALRVLKPGGHVLSFGGTRTYHRMVVNIEDAGFEIRDQIQWIYGSGFPKSHNLNGEWQGWGTALKPANEPIVLARKQLIGTVAENVQTFGTGALNIDASRIGTSADMNPSDFDDTKRKSPKFSGKFNGGEVGEFRNRTGEVPNGRWPANVLFDEEAAAVLDEQSGILKSGSLAPGHKRGNGTGNSLTGGASRFFYVAKASKRERGDGNHHPTVKPIKLMEYLVRLITPPGGTVLDPFMGSGTTGIAAKNLGFGFVGIELNEGYFKIAKSRLG